MKSLKLVKLNSFLKFFVGVGVLHLLCPQSLLAQSSERFTLDAVQFETKDGVAAQSLSGSANHRMFLDKEGSNLLTIGLTVSQVNLEDNTLTDPDRDRQLRLVAPELSLLRILNDTYSLIATLRPGFYGDLSGNLADQFRLEGGFVITRFMNSNLTLGIGLGRGTNFGRDLVVPLIQFLYFPTEKIVIRGLLPVNASLWYIPSQQWEFGVLYKLQGSVFNLDETNIANAERIGLAAAQIGLGTRYKVAENNYFSFEFGFTALRRYEWVDDNKTSFEIGKIPLLERDLNPVPYASFGFVQKF